MWNNWRVLNLAIVRKIANSQNWKPCQSLLLNGIHQRRLIKTHVLALISPISLSSLTQRNFENSNMDRASYSDRRSQGQRWSGMRMSWASLNVVEVLFYTSMRYIYECPLLQYTWKMPNAPYHTILSSKNVDLIAIKTRTKSLCQRTLGKALSILIMRYCSRRALLFPTMLKVLLSQTNLSFFHPQLHPVTKFAGIASVVQNPYRQFHSIFLKCKLRD